MNISATTWQNLSKLLDEALDLEPGARATWLERLSSTQPELAPSVRKLLAAHASSETADLLARLPELSGTARPLTALEPGDLIGPYRLERELGSGGMADVWLSERADGAFTREVALKLPMISRLRRDLAQRFARERDILARLEHPHIARLYDAGVTDDSLPYLAMEYVDGHPITEYCDQHELTIDARLKLFLQVLEAVQYAHANLIIHRDLKPSNILVTADGQVRLLDFGIAKLLAGDDTARETQLTQLAGRALTPDYASPEQIKGEPLTIATDIYSLGVVLYELLAGTRPYQLRVKSAAQLEQAIVEAQPARPSSVITPSSAAARGTTQPRLRRALTGDLDTITLKALSKVPAQRYLTASDFAQDLRNTELGLPVRARPESWSYRTRKFVARNRLAVGAAGAIATILVVSTTVSIRQARIATQQTAVAQREAKRAQAVQRFLLELFQSNTDAQPDPVKARETTARQLLDAGATRVTGQLSDVPEVQDEVLTTLSDMYRALGLSEKQAEMQRQRADVLRRLFGNNDPRVAEALMSQASALRTTPDVRKAPALLAEAKAIIDASPQASPLLRARLLTDLARADMYTDVTKMRRYAHQAVEQLQGLGSPSQLAAALRLEALANFFLGDWGAAIELHENALSELRKNELRPFNLVVTVTVELADAHARRGDYPTAERLFRELIVETSRRNGETHVDTLHVEARLVGLLHATARRDEARRLRESMLQKLERSEAKTDVGMANTLRRNTAATLLADGQFGTALPMARAAAEESRRLFPNTIVLGSRLLVLGSVLTELGRYQDAVRILDEAASTELAALGPDALPIAEGPFVIARALNAIATGHSQDAARALQRFISTPPPDHVMVARDQLQARIVLASAHLQLAQVAEAEQVARSALDELQRSPMRDYYQTLEADAALQMGRAQLQSGNAASARGYLRRSLTLRTANDHPASPWIAEAQIALAECLAISGDKAQARSLLQQAAAIQAQHSELGEHHKRPLVDARRRLGASS